MIILNAEEKDYMSICRSIQNAHIAYITPQHIKEDINKHRLFVVKEKEKILGFAALVYCSEFNNFAIKRLCIPNKKNRGKGIAKFIIHYFVSIHSLINYPLVCTPWVDNKVMRKILEQEGFKYIATFNINWTLYELTP